MAVTNGQMLSTRYGSVEVISNNWLFEVILFIGLFICLLDYFVYWVIENPREKHELESGEKVSSGKSLFIVVGQ